MWAHAELRGSNEDPKLQSTEDHKRVLDGFLLFAESSTTGSRMASARLQIFNLGSLISSLSKRGQMHICCSKEVYVGNRVDSWTEEKTRLGGHQRASAKMQDADFKGDWI